MKRLATGLLLVLISIALLPSLAISSGMGGIAGSIMSQMPGATPAMPVAPDELLRQSRRLIQVSPLSARAYLADGLARDKQGNRAAAEALISWSALLDPRLFESRLWLGLRYFETGRIAAALDQLHPLYTLAPTFQPQVSFILAGAARVPAARRLIATRFANDPIILNVAARAQQSGMPPQGLIELFAPTRLQALPDGVSTAQRLLIGESLAKADLVRAYALWQVPLGRKPDNAIFDGDFGGQDVTGPFTWTLSKDAAITARRIDVSLAGHSTAAELRSSSVVPITMAEQTVVLAPGAYTLRALVRSDAEANSPAGFGWTIKCSRTGEELAHLPIGGTAGRWVPGNWSLSIPAACPVQTLQIISDAAASGQQESTISITGTAVHPNQG